MMLSSSREDSRLLSTGAKGRQQSSISPQSIFMDREDSKMSCSSIRTCLFPVALYTLHVALCGCNLQGVEVPQGPSFLMSPRLQCLASSPVKLSVPPTCYFPPSRQANSLVGKAASKASLISFALHPLPHPFLVIFTFLQLSNIFYHVFFHIQHIFSSCHQQESWFELPGLSLLVAEIFTFNIFYCSSNKLNYFYSELGKLNDSISLSFNSFLTRS